MWQLREIERKPFIKWLWKQEVTKLTTVGLLSKPSFTLWHRSSHSSCTKTVCLEKTERHINSLISIDFTSLIYWFVWFEALTAHCQKYTSIYFSCKIASIKNGVRSSTLNLCSSQNKLWLLRTSENKSMEWN